MKVTIHLVDGSRITIGRMDGVMDLLDVWRSGDSAVLAVSLDEVSVTHIARSQIVRIDVDPADESRRRR